MAEMTSEKEVTCFCGCKDCQGAGWNWSLHCDTCSFFGASSLANWGKERLPAQSVDAESDKAKPTPCSKCGRDWFKGNDGIWTHSCIKSIASQSRDVDEREALIDLIERGPARPIPAAAPAPQSSNEAEVTLEPLPQPESWDLNPESRAEVTEKWLDIREEQLKSAIAQLTAAREESAKQAAELAELRAKLAADAWLSVEERLPEPGRNVLISVGGDVEMARYFNRQWTLLRTDPQDDSIYFEEEQVQHWRPLQPSPADAVLSEQGGR